MSNLTEGFAIDAETGDFTFGNETEERGLTPVAQQAALGTGFESTPRTTTTGTNVVSNTKAQLLETVEGQQIALNSTGFGGSPPLDIDGKRGPATIAATKRFQSAVGLNPDGVFGPLTKQKMLAILNGDVAPPDPPATPAPPTAAQIVKATSSGATPAPTATIAAQPVSNVTKGPTAIDKLLADKKKLAMIGGGILLAGLVGYAVYHHAKAR